MAINLPDMQNMYYPYSLDQERHRLEEINRRNALTEAMMAKARRTWEDRPTSEEVPKPPAPNKLLLLLDKP